MMYQMQYAIDMLPIANFVLHMLCIRTSQLSGLVVLVIDAAPHFFIDKQKCSHANVFVGENLLLPHGSNTTAEVVMPTYNCLFIYFFCFLLQNFQILSHTVLLEKYSFNNPRYWGQPNKFIPWSSGGPSHQLIWSTRNNHERERERVPGIWRVSTWKLLYCFQSKYGWTSSHIIWLQDFGRGGSCLLPPPLPPLFSIWMTKNQEKEIPMKILHGNNWFYSVLSQW